MSNRESRKSFFPAWLGCTTNRRVARQAATERNEGCTPRMEGRSALGFLGETLFYGFRLRATLRLSYIKDQSRRFPPSSSHSNNNHPLKQPSNAQQARQLQQSSQTQSTTPRMPFFKSSKNQSASAASTPAQTPRSSMHESRPAAQISKMTRDQALQMALEKSYGGHVFQGNIRL